MLTIFAWISLALAFGCALVIVVDETRHPQKMWIMNVVWPVTALYLSVFTLWAYFARGRGMSRDAMQSMSKEQMDQRMKQQQEQARRSPTWTQTALSDSHCGAGCVLADIATEFAVFGVGATVLGTELYASYLWDFIAAWLLGIVFQYFTIKPMRNMSVGGGIWAAIKADMLSILLFQVGMYGWMALVFFRFFPQPHLHPNEPAYWLMMQIAMTCGYVTALPINWFLSRSAGKKRWDNEGKLLTFDAKGGCADRAIARTACRISGISCSKGRACGGGRHPAILLSQAD